MFRDLCLRSPATQLNCRWAKTNNHTTPITQRVGWLYRLVVGSIFDKKATILVVISSSTPVPRLSALHPTMALNALAYDPQGQILLGVDEKILRHIQNGVKFENICGGGYPGSPGTVYSSGSIVVTTYRMILLPTLKLPTFQSLVVPFSLCTKLKPDIPWIGSATVEGVVVPASMRAPLFSGLPSAAKFKITFSNKSDCEAVGKIVTQQYSEALSAINQGLMNSGHAFARVQPSMQAFPQTAANVHAPPPPSRPSQFLYDRCRSPFCRCAVVAAKEGMAFVDAANPSLIYVNVPTASTQHTAAMISPEESAAMSAIVANANVVATTLEVEGSPNTATTSTTAASAAAVNNNDRKSAPAMVAQPASSVPMMYPQLPSSYTQLQSAAASLPVYAISSSAPPPQQPMMVMQYQQPVMTVASPASLQPMVVTPSSPSKEVEGSPSPVNQESQSLLPPQQSAQVGLVAEASSSTPAYSVGSAQPVAIADAEVELLDLSNSQKAVPAFAATVSDSAAAKLKAKSKAKMAVVV